GKRTQRTPPRLDQSGCCARARRRGGISGGQTPRRARRGDADRSVREAILSRWRPPFAFSRSLGRGAVRSRRGGGCARRAFANFVRRLAETRQHVAPPASRRRRPCMLPWRLGGIGCF